MLVKFGQYAEQPTRIPRAEFLTAWQIIEFCIEKEIDELGWYQFKLPVDGILRGSFFCKLRKHHYNDDGTLWGTNGYSAFMHVSEFINLLDICECVIHSRYIEIPNPRRKPIILEDWIKEGF